MSNDVVNNNEIEIQNQENQEVVPAAIVSTTEETTPIEANIEQSNNIEQPIDAAKIEKYISKRREIIVKMNNLHDDINIDLSQKISQFKSLNNEWKNLSGDEQHEQYKSIAKEYNTLQDKFFELNKINRELIEYNHKKNFELKTVICEKAEKLIDEEIVKAFRTLQILHKEWKEVGPVAQEQSEEIWAKFKASSDEINNKYSVFLSENKEKNEANIQTKSSWCEEVENIDTNTLSTYKDWENTADKIKEINKQFNDLFISDNKQNQQLYKRLRTACDNFFAKKSVFYAEKKNEMQVNLEKKTELLAKAEELKNSTDWKNTTNKIIELQKEWKTIGPTNHRNSKSTWEQFVAACDYFFEQKSKLYTSKKDEERTNLQLKKDLIEKINQYELVEDETTNLNNIKEFYKEYNAIGHIPYKEKDNVYNLFKDAVNKQYNNIRVKFHIEGRNYGNDRQKLQRKAEQLKTEISTCENNIGFFANTNKNNPIVKEAERKIENLRIELSAILDQLNKLED